MSQAGRLKISKKSNKLPALALLPSAPVLTLTDLHIKTPTTHPPVNVLRFLISAQQKPICYDAPVGNKLRLLLDTASDFSMNGELSEKGFELIVVHYKTSKLSVSPTKSIYSDGEKTVTLIWGQFEVDRFEIDSVSIFLRNNELDVTMGSVRVLFLLHKKGGQVLLWPSVRQQPKNVNTQGILGKTIIQYEELSGSKIKIMDQEFPAILSSATDYGLPMGPTVECWFVPFQSALQGELADFIVSEL